ncbi:hypothetical protein QS713_00915 [Gleimia hominis]|uniref:Uncharacterized protein n=1 Tax=Gleimia hominis TaxID=595468 RepID=A0ABU3I8C3_9ACTO|nr:hypothetical protein [Gleimia hominis]MDT3766632.1 hypothetical protein [Gleimia hominis]
MSKTSATQWGEPRFLFNPTEPVRPAIIVTLSFVLAPAAFLLLFTSVGRLLNAGAGGTPLASPTGQLGVLGSAILLLLIAHTVRWSNAGMGVLTIWSAALTLIYAAQGLLGASSCTQALTRWTQLPLYACSICVGVTLMTKYMTTRAPQPNPRIPAWLAFTCAFVLSGAIVGMLYVLAPRNVDAIRLGDASLLPARTSGEVALIVLTCLGAMVLALLANISVGAVQAAAWIFFLIPGLIVVPTVTTLTDVTATPSNSAIIAWQMTMPVCATIGVLLATTTHAIALAHNPQTSG